MAKKKNPDYKPSISLQKGISGALLAFLSAGTVYLAGKGLDIDLTQIVDNEAAAKALTAVLLAMGYAVAEFARNWAKNSRIKGK